MWLHVASCWAPPSNGHYAAPPKGYYVATPPMVTMLGHHPKDHYAGHPHPKGYCVGHPPKGNHVGHHPRVIMLQGLLCWPTPPHPPKGYHAGSPHPHPPKGHYAGHASAADPHMSQVVANPIVQVFGIAVRAQIVPNFGVCSAVAGGAFSRGTFWIWLKICRFRVGVVGRGGFCRGVLDLAENRSFSGSGGPGGFKTILKGGGPPGSSRSPPLRFIWRCPAGRCPASHPAGPRPAGGCPPSRRMPGQAAGARPQAGARPTGRVCQWWWVCPVVVVVVLGLSVVALGVLVAGGGCVSGCVSRVRCVRVGGVCQWRSWVCQWGGGGCQRGCVSGGGGGGPVWSRWVCQWQWSGCTTTTTCPLLLVVLLLVALLQAVLLRVVTSRGGLLLVVLLLVVLLLVVLLLVILP